MKFLLLFYVCSTSCAVRFGVVNVPKKEEVFPVYATSAYVAPRGPRSYARVSNYSNWVNNAAKDNDTFEVMVGSKYLVQDRLNSPVRRSFVGTKLEVVRENETDATERLVLNQHRKCVETNDFWACLKYKSLKFVEELVVPIEAENVSEIIKSDLIRNGSGPQLVGLPPVTGNTNTELARMAGGSFFGEIGQFVLEQIDRFILRHGVVVAVSQLQEDQPRQLDTPWLVSLDQHSRSKRSDGSAKLKRKEMAIIFPLLVLFKFFKIKLVLLPILLTVLIIKKLLIIMLTVTPNLLGLFRFCRPVTPLPPFGFQSAGILQEIGDTRGEFSSNYGYATPYRDQAGYRQRDKLKPADAVYGDY